MLYLVALPIGNLEDITFRARHTLAKVDIILAEDTRKTSFLLKHLGIKKKVLLSFYEHNENKRIPYVVKLLREGRKIALVSSAGTPLISDPGYKLVRECIERGIEVISCPGPSAVISSLVVSGLATDKFLFLGFLPRKPGKKKQVLEQVKSLPATLVIFESPFRIKKTLASIRDILGNRQVVLVREQTKVFEEKIRGSIEDVLSRIPSAGLKGEITLIVSGQPNL